MRVLERKQEGSVLRCSMHQWPPVTCAPPALMWIYSINPFGLPSWATSASQRYTSERRLCNHPSGVETHAESEKIILFELPSLRYPQSVFCWVTLFWRRLEQTVNEPTRTCITSHTRGLREEGAARQHQQATHVFWSPSVQESLATKPSPGSLWLFWYMSSLNQWFLAKYVCICISRWLLMSWVTPVVMPIKYAGG